MSQQVRSPETQDRTPGEVLGIIGDLSASAIGATGVMLLVNVEGPVWARVVLGIVPATIAMYGVYEVGFGRRQTNEPRQQG